MIGLIPKLLTSLITEHYSKDDLNHIYHAANIPEDRTYLSNQYYSDQEWQSLFHSTLQHYNLSEDKALQLYATYFLDHVLKTFPTWFDMAKNSYDFLSLQPIIHNSFASGLVDSKKRDAAIDKFSIETLPNHLITYYRSKNQLCPLYMYLAQAVANHYGDTITIEETKCMRNGNSECEIHVRW